MTPEERLDELQKKYDLLQEMMTAHIRRMSNPVWIVQPQFLGRVDSLDPDLDMDKGL